MPGALGVIDFNHRDYDPLLLSQTLDLLSLGKTKTIHFEDGFACASSLMNTPLKGERIYQDVNNVICFAGDLIENDAVPWQDIITIIEQNKYERFKDYQGNFVIAFFEKGRKRVTIVSDRRSQQPIYYKKTSSGLIFSTDMSTFCRLNESAEFNENWLYDLFFFNFPVGQTTFLKNVFRMPPASILEYDFRDSKISISQYSDIFRKPNQQLEGMQSFELAKRIFEDRVPRYYLGSDKIACALTDGWDGRTMLALAPNIDNIVSYTYGVPGCADIMGATKAAQLAGVRHRNIHFNNDFVGRLPSYILKTVFLSSGLQSILRSTLLYVYENLTNYGKEFPLIISGIALDELFRGNHASPNPISFDIARIFQKGKLELERGVWSEVLGNKYPEFEKAVLQKLRYLKDTFGDFRSTEHHLLFKMYLQGPQYFSGELKIAENFSTVRVPSWDTNLIDLAFSIKESALSFSAFTGLPRSGKSVVELQSHLLQALSPRFAKIPVRNTRPDIALKSQFIYDTYMLYKILLKRISWLGKKSPPLEDWNNWLNLVHMSFIDKLIFSDNSRIKQYVTRGFLEGLRVKRDIHWVGKLVTAEIILRLIENRWMNVSII